MPLNRYIPEASGRMGRAWTLGTIEGAALLEFGSMGHDVYLQKWQNQLGLFAGAQVYSTHINEKEIVLGQTRRLEEAIKKLAEEKERPEAIFILPSSILEMIGTDIAEKCEELSRSYRLRLISSKKGGFMETAPQGMEEALEQLAQEIVEPPEKEEPSFNLLGCCADFSRYSSDALEIERIMQGAFSLQMHCALTGIASMEKIRTMSRARVNLVLRWEGLKAAQTLERRFGMPYVYAPSYGLEDTMEWIDKASHVLGQEVNRAFIQRNLEEAEAYIQACRRYFAPFARHATMPALNLGGHSDRVKGIARLAFERIGLRQGEVWVNDRREKEIAMLRDDQAYEHIHSGLTLAAPEIVQKAGMPAEYALSWGVLPHDINPYAAPLAGFRGVIELCCLFARA